MTEQQGNIPEAEQDSPQREKNTVKDYFRLGPVFGYFFRRKDPNRPRNFNLRMMHGINKLSMLMFLVALIIIIVRRCS